MGRTSCDLRPSQGADPRGRVMRTNGQTWSRSLNRQLTPRPSTAAIEKPGCPSSICPVERVAMKIVRPSLVSFVVVGVPHIHAGDVWIRASSRAETLGTFAEVRRVGVHENGDVLADRLGLLDFLSAQTSCAGPNRKSGPPRSRRHDIQKQAPMSADDDGRRQPLGAKHVVKGGERSGFEVVNRQAGYAASSASARPQPAPGRTALACHRPRCRRAAAREIDAVCRQAVHQIDDAQKIAMVLFTGPRDVQVADVKPTEQSGLILHAPLPFQRKSSARWWWRAGTTGRRRGRIGSGRWRRCGDLRELRRISFDRLRFDHASTRSFEASALEQ